MARRSTRLSLKKTSDTSRDVVDTAKRRLFEDADEIEGHKLKTNSGASCQNSHQGSKRKILDAGADTSSVSVVGVSICICCLIIILLSFCLPHWFVFYLSGTIEERDGQLYIHFRNNQRVYVIGLVTAAAASSVCALLCCCTSWTVTYFDSVDPGRNPPTPISPSKYRQQSGHTFHTSYATSLLNSIAVALYVLWWRRTDYLVL